MNAYANWIIGLAVAYTAVLIILGNLVRKKATTADGFWVGGRSFKPWMVFVAITGLFSGSTFISIMELSYLKGISAGWYGVAEMVHVLIIALLLIGIFRRKLIVTISGLIGERFGRTALGVAGAITAFTFPMWSVATALSFASAVSAFTKIPITTSVIISALLLLIYLQAGGMWSVVVTQTANTILFGVMLIIGAIAFFIKPGFAGLAQLAATKPQMFSLTEVGLQTIIAWFATFLINVLLAQAALQMATACRTVEDGRKGLLWAFIGTIPLIFFGVLLGLAAAVVVPGGQRGMIQVPLYLAQVLPAPLVGLFFLGVWACALGWGGPCQFSGSTSLGRDLTGAINPALTDQQKVKYTRISLVLLTVLMIALSFFRSEQAAWWNVLAWTLRNGATFAPVVAALFWPLATRRAAVTAMLCGFLTGLAWYSLGGWHPTKFYYNVHPVFVGMSANILGIILVTLVETAGEWQLGGARVSPQRRTLAWVAGISALALAVLIAMGKSTLYKMGLIGLLGFLIVVCILCLTLALVVPVERKISQPV